MAVCENLAGDVLASQTVQWSTSSKAWTGGAGMADASLNRRMTARLGPSVAFAQIGIVGFDGQIALEALRPAGACPDAALRHAGPAGRPAGVRGGGRLGPALARAGCHQPARRDSHRQPAGRPGRSDAGLLNPLHRARRRGLDQQHGSGDGAQRIEHHHRPRGGDALRGCDQAAGAVICLISRTTKEHRRNHMIGMPSVPLEDRHHLPIKVERHQVGPCLVHESGFDEGRNDMPVPIDVHIEFCARWPMPRIQARADFTRHGFDVAPLRHHVDRLHRSVSNGQANPRARPPDQQHCRPRRD